MSIVPCPQCGKRVSSLSPICVNCGFQRGEASEEDLVVWRLRQCRDRIYHLNMISYLIITLLVAGFGWYWWSSSGFAEPSSAGPFALMGISAVAYLVVRGLLFVARRKQKELKQAAP